MLRRAGLNVHLPAAPAGRPLCCGRTYLAAGLLEPARTEARRLLAALRPLAAAGVPIVGLEPSCLLTLRDEYAALLSPAELGDVPEQAKLLPEFVAATAANGLDFCLHPVPARRALVHGHCHEKAFGAMAAIEATLRLVPGLEFEVIDAGCCGMAGSFGYEAEHVDLSRRIGEMGPLPAVRDADPETLIVADGTSCRAQFRDFAARRAHHIAEVLALAQDGAGEIEGDR